MIFGLSFLITLYLSLLFPRIAMSAQRVSSRFFLRVFSGLSGLDCLICLTVLSLARTATRIGVVFFGARLLACSIKF